MVDIAQVVDKAQERCSEGAGRLTTRRRQVLTALLSADTAVSAYELADLYEKEYGQSIPPMSVYRILGFLEEHNLAHRLNLVNKYIACSHITCAHDHDIPQFLICERCKRVSEIRVSSAAIDSLERQVDEAGFRLMNRQLELNCLCADCADAAD